MDRKLINPQIVTDIANAIRAKKGTTGTINVSQLANEIATISGGGVADSTKTLIGVISGVTPTDELSTNNAIAKGATDTPSEETFTERTTAEGGSIKDTIAFVDKVKGNCIKFNQLLVNDFSYFSTFSRVSKVINDDSITITSNNDSASLKAALSSDSRYFPLGHTVIAVAKMKGTITSGSKGLLGFAKASGVMVSSYSSILDQSSTNWVSCFTIATINSEITQFQLRLGNTSPTGDTITAKDIMLFDLTEMGMTDVTSADQFAQRLGYANALSMPYLAYQSDTIVLTNRRNLVSSYSRNLWDGELIQGYFGETTETFISHNGRLSNRTPIEVNGGVTIFVNIPYTDSSNYIAVNIATYDVNHSRIEESGWKTKVQITNGYTLPSNTKYVCVRFYNRVDNITASTFSIDECNTIYPNRILNISDSQNGEYTPYFAPDSLPINARNLVDSQGNTIFPNGMQSNGTTYDEWDMANGVVVKRIANDGTIMATPTTYNVAKVKAYYKVSQNGKEVATSTDNSAPFKADISYRGLSAEDVINAING